MNSIHKVVFYSLEKTIKLYRQFAQQRIKREGYQITIDQWLVLKTIQEDDSISQQQLASKVFKDIASVTRIIDLLVKSGYLLRDLHLEDRRRFALTLTKEGTEIIASLESIVDQNRSQALKGLSSDEIDFLQAILFKIASNVDKN